MTLPPLGPVQSGGHDNNNGPEVPYYSLWTGPNGTSSLATCALGGFEMKSVGGQAAARESEAAVGGAVVWSFIETQDGSRV